jgi:3-deoxy-D-manno-octulosonate 8-phosphate phosphatase (KDO 8-P phosphatase)
MSRVWTLPYPVPDDVVARAASIRLAAFDVDGVLTDGSVTYGPRGEDYKTFNIKDGQGLKSLLDCGIEVALISARSSPGVDCRAGELGIRRVHTGVADKVGAIGALLEACALNADQCCYVGDDLVDVPVMLRCALGIAVADAHHAVRHVASWVTPSGGGHGAVREVCDVILYAQQKFDDIMDRQMALSTTP